MRKSAGFILLTLLPVAALSHCWWQNRAVPTVGGVHEFGSPVQDLALDVCSYDGTPYTVGSSNTYAVERLAHADGFLMADPLAAEGWFKAIRTPGDDSAHAVHADANGIYVVGQTNGDLTHSEVREGLGAFVIKYDATGRALWARQFGGDKGDSGQGVAADGTGIYVVGYLGWDPSATPFPSGASAFVRKYGFDGTVLWRREFGPQAGGWATAAVADDTGVYVVGYLGSIALGRAPGGALNGFLRKYASDGTECWTRQVGAPGDMPVDVCIHAAYVYVVCQGSLSKYDADGNPSWPRPVRIGGDRYATGVFANDRGVYLVGGVSALFSADYWSPRGPSQDAFLARYTHDGGRRWVRRFGTRWDDVAFAVAGGDSTLYVVGVTKYASPQWYRWGDDYAWLRVLHVSEGP